VAAGKGGGRAVDRLDFLSRARSRPAEVLRTSLDDEETRELLTTRNVATTVSLVRKGLIEMGTCQLRAVVSVPA
jgi:hypothetical protein